MITKYYTFQESKQIIGASTTYTKWFTVDEVYELIAFLKLTNQGNYTNETLNIIPQIRTLDSDAIDLKDVKFTEIGDKTGSLPFLDYLPFVGFGSQVRFKMVTTGDSPDYTFKLTGVGKR